MQATLSTFDWRQRISINPRICHGTACIKGTPIPVSVVVDNLSAGTPHAGIFASYPTLRREDLEAALRYAAELTRESTIELLALETAV